MEDIRDWSALLCDLLVQIATCIPCVEDFMAFRGVCTSWRAAASKDKFKSSWPRVPLLMLAEKEGSNDREFYSLSRAKICMRLSLPEAKGKKLIEARFGWFLTIASTSSGWPSTGELNLLNPFTGQQIELPNEMTFPDYQDYDSATYISRAVLSDNPSHTSNFVLVVIHSWSYYLGFWRPMDKAWTKIESPRTETGTIYDVNYYNGKFYAINSQGDIWVWDMTAPDLKVANIILTIDQALLWCRWGYLVESSKGELLVISREGYQIDDYNDYGVSNFIIVQLDVKNKQWKRIFSLGDDAIFVGYNAAFSVTSSNLPTSMVKSNCIYFSDDCRESYMYLGSRGGGGGGKDTGVYHVEDEKIERFDVQSLSLICPPLWIAPTS